jgi:SAM-dependent methyltransferase
MSTDCPSPNGSFDAAFAHAVLMHLREPVRALAELRGVLRPGVVVGVRDSDWGARLHAPATPLLEKWYALTVRVRQCNGGDPFMGRRHRRLLLESGFARAEATVSVSSAGTPEETRRRATSPQGATAGLCPDGAGGALDG